MASPDRTTGAPAEAGSWFATTHWSIVLKASDRSSPLAADALEKLCSAYWYPLYAYVRRQGLDEHSAKDLTQGFFARFLAGESLSRVDREKGKFRCFLLASLKHFLADEWDKARAQKRGGEKIHVSLDDTGGEERYRHEPVDTMGPDKLYERQWAFTVLEQAGKRLEEEYCRAGKSDLYQRLRAFEPGGDDAPRYVEVASELGLSEGGLRTAVFRMRQRYRALLREEVAHTVDDPGEVDEEIRYLIRVVSGAG